MSDQVSKFGEKTKKWPLRRIIVFSLLVLLVCAGVAGYVFRDSLNLDAVRRFVRYLNVSGTQEGGQFVFDAGNSNQYADFDGGLAVASGTGLSAYEAGGSETVLVQEKMATPAIRQAGKFVLAFDVGGYALHEISTSKGSVLDVTSQRPVLDADLAEDGSLCYSTSESGYKSVLCVYNANQTLIYRRLSASQYLPVCAVSRGAEYVAAAALGQAEGSYETSIQLFRTDSEDLAGEISFGNELIYDLAFTDEKTVLAVGEQHARWFSQTGERLGSYDYSEFYLKDFDFGGSGFLTLSLNMYKAGNSCTVVTVSPSGEELGSSSYTEEILDSSAAGNYVAVLTANGLDLYKQDMTRTARLDATQSATAVVMRMDGTALLLSGGTGRKFIP